jgi:hypothetical protein
MASVLSAKASGLDLLHTHLATGRTTLSTPGSPALGKSQGKLSTIQAVMVGVLLCLANLFLEPRLIFPAS